MEKNLAIASNRKRTQRKSKKPSVLEKSKGKNRKGPSKAALARIIDRKRAEEEIHKKEEDLAKQEEEHAQALEKKWKEEAEEIKRKKRERNRKLKQKRKKKVEQRKREQKISHLVCLTKVSEVLETNFSMPPSPSQDSSVPKAQINPEIPSVGKFSLKNLEPVLEDAEGQEREKETSFIPEDWEELFKEESNLISEWEEFSEKIFETPLLEEKTEEIPKKEKKSPVIVVLGSVDAGKTTLLDKIRGTSIQLREAGGITQHIGSTFFPIETLIAQTEKIFSKSKMQVQIPGLLFLDTPGHESFHHLRSRGSSVCDMAILVVDGMHEISPSTRELIQWLGKKKIPFVVALNKMDKIYDWKSQKDSSWKKTFRTQSIPVKEEFYRRVKTWQYNLQSEGWNAELYFQNADPKHVLSLIPFSAQTGEGISDLFYFLIKFTQEHLLFRTIKTGKFKATVLEVQEIPKFGTTIDVLLLDGFLRTGEEIILWSGKGSKEPIRTKIRALLTSTPQTELCSEHSYLSLKEVEAVQGVKIYASGLEEAMSGSSLWVLREGENEEEIWEQIQRERPSWNPLLCEKGITVHSSTWGGLEALLELLSNSKIPVSTVNIGSIHCFNVKLASVYLKENSKHAEYGTILGFDVKIDSEAQDLAEKLGVKIFCSDVIYHLLDSFCRWKAEQKAREKEEQKSQAVFPCLLRILPEHIYHVKNPFIFGVEIMEGVAMKGTPLCIPKKQLFLGRIVCLEDHGREIREAKKGKQVSVKIEGSGTEMYGRQFDFKDLLYSQVTRESIDLFKEFFQENLRLYKDCNVVSLLRDLKKIFHISG